MSELPQDIVLDPENPPAALPPLPDGFTWGLKVTAEAEVIPASQSKEE